MRNLDLAATRLEPGRRTLVGVSGGPDSLALLHFLHSNGLPVVAASFNHQLRPEAGQDVDFVRGIAEKLGMPFLTDTADVAAYAREKGMSIEEAARELRYQFLFKAARNSNSQAVAVGHTADDQAETVLMHFLRGAGLSGLKGMPARLVLTVFDPEIPLVRPLLTWTRAETEAYCLANNLEPRSDATNSDTHYFRNRLRLELLPILEGYNPRIRQNLVKTALALQGDANLLEELIENAWMQSVRSSGNGYVQFDLAVLHGLSLPLRRNLFRKAAFTLRPALRDVDFEALERVSTLKPVELAGGLKTILEAGNLYLCKDASDLPNEDYPQLQGEMDLVPGRNILTNSWMINRRELTGSSLFAEARWNNDPYTAWLDAETASKRLWARPPRKGDRFEPLGMPNQKAKVSELMINLKIPNRLRAAWPLVCVGDQIAWVAGLRMTENFKVTEKTRRAFIIEIIKNPGQV